MKMFFRLTALVSLSVFMLAGSAALAQSGDLPGIAKYHRIVFVGDSITYYGGYVDDIETYVLLHNPHTTITFLNLGLRSETVSGLTETGYMDGKFPRPDAHARIGDLLVKTDPDLIVADYGMNDGIYQPFDEDRFQKFKDGMMWLHERAMEYGIPIVHVTPSPFDPQPIQAKLTPDGARGFSGPCTNYDDVLGRYAAWLVDQRTNGWDVVDIHTPMNQFLAAHRKADPNYALSRDGVHPNAIGHWLMARELLMHWGAPKDLGTIDSVEGILMNSTGDELLKSVTQQQDVLRDAWLTYVGHLYPGHTVGPPLDDAKKQAADLDVKIRALAAGVAGK